MSAKIAVVDQRTALENQILGSHEELDRDLQLLASVRAAEPGTIRRDTRPFSEIREEAIRARQTQQFNRDDLDEMKRAGCIGEVHDATVAARPCPLASEPRVAERIGMLVTSENEARRILLEFVVTTSPDLTRQDLPQVVAAYARMQRERARKGEWSRAEDGTWVVVE